MWRLLHLVSIVGSWVVALNQAKTVLDLSHSVDENSMRWPNAKPFKKEAKYRNFTDAGYWYESYNFCTGEHTSTHLDAPSHFAVNKWTVDQIPLMHLMGSGVVVDIQHKVEKDPLAELTQEDLLAWLQLHGPLPDGVILFVRTGWGSRYGDADAYFGSSNTSNLRFPGIHAEAAQLLADYQADTGRRVFGVGLDTPSVDHGKTTTFPTHVILGTSNIYGLENVANLQKLPLTGFEVLVMPMKLTGGSGAPARIVATVPDQQTSGAASALPLLPLLTVSAAALVLH